MALPETCTVNELAKYLGYSPGYIRDLARFGIIPRECIVRPFPKSRYRFLVNKTMKWAQAGPTDHQARIRRIMDERRENRGANFNDYNGD